MQTEVKQKSALSLAYLGDAIYESLVREYVMKHSNASPGILHRMTVSVVCAEAQSSALEMLKPHLSEEELAVVRRGRNASKATIPKNASSEAYRASTALEALFGYLYMMEKKERIEQLFRLISSVQIENALSQREKRNAG